MSMIVKIAMQGITDLEVLLAALKEMKIKAASLVSGEESKGKLLAVAYIQGHRIGFLRSRNGEIEMRGDRNWQIMKNDDFRLQLKQQYSLAAVKNKLTELRYNLVSVDSMEDGSVKVVARAWR